MKNLPVRDRKTEQQLAANQNAEHDLKARLLSGDAEIIDAIILAGSVAIRAKDLHAIIRERELIEKKFQAISCLTLGSGLPGEAAPTTCRDNLRCAKAPPPYG